MHIQPYLQFEGSCEEALDFYTTAIGATVQMMMRHKDSPMPAPAGQLPPGSENKIIHAEFKVGDSLVMATDGLCQGAAKFHGFSLSLFAKDEAEAKALFARLAAGGQVRMPIAKTFWSPAFGMLIDRFGVSWMLNVASS